MSPPRRGAAQAPAPPPLPGGMPALSDRDFERFQAWIHAATGIYLAPVKKALLVARVGRRLRALGMDSFAGYFQLVSGPAAGAELDLFLDCITTHETRFFREPRQLEFLERQVLPAWSASAASGVRPRRVRAWSAGCATGEEPYSLAMLLLDQLPPSAGFAHEILATDLSQRVLEHGRAGIYPLARAGEIPGRYRDACMLRGTGSQQGRMRASPQLRALVRFQALNLNDADYAVGEPFDLILCRNVLIYFDPASRAAVIDRLISRLAAGGYLLLGHAESLREVSSRVRLVAPTVYTHAADPERGA